MSQLNIIIYIAIFLFIAILVLFYHVNSLLEKSEEGNYVNINLWTFETQNGMPNGPVKQVKGKYEMKLLQKNFKLKIPVIINTNDEIIKPPMFEQGGNLWVYHIIVQKANSINLIVLYAGSPDGNISPICAEVKKYKETEFLKIVD